MASEEEALRAENARLVADMASMKKKIMVALKKQQAELQAKVQAAEQRAVAAEAAVAAAKSTMLNEVGNGSTENGVVSDIRGWFQPQLSTSSPARNPSEEADDYTSESVTAGGSPESSFTEVTSRGLADHTEDEALQTIKRLWGEVERLKEELEEERLRSKKQEDAAFSERNRLQLEIKELKVIVQEQTKQGDEIRERFESELSRIRRDATEQIEQLKEANEKLENQLLAAAEQVSDAFARIATTHDDMERVSKEGHESRRAHVELLREHEITREELERIRAALSQAKKDAEDKAKEMEEMVAVRKAAQEGQEAAMAQLMQRLHEVQVLDFPSSQMEASGDAKDMEQLSKLSLESLFAEKAELEKLLEEKNSALLEVQKHAADLENRLNSIDSSTLKSTEYHDLKVKAEDEDRNSIAITLSELKTENEGLRSRLQEFESQIRAREDLHETDLMQELEKLGKQLQESHAAQLAAEELAKQNKKAYADEQQRAEGLFHDLTEVHRTMDEELKARDEKYAELDAKFGKLQKRAKQRIQEVQKEKEDIEAQLSAAMEKAAKAISQHSSLQQDLERIRAQAGEALRSLDGERQQLRNSNNRQKEIIDELQHRVGAKEQELARAQQLTSEKEQMLQELADKLSETDAKHEAFVADLVIKHGKLVESLEAQLSDAVQERSKAAETLSSLQVQLAKKESQIAELDAASTGEAVRLGASLEASRGELSRLEQEYRKEREIWEAAVEALKKKLEDIEKIHMQEELEAAKARSRLESELEGQRQALSVIQVELSTARDQVARLGNDFNSYKVRAYSLLQKKEAELLAAKDADRMAGQEQALKEAQREATAAAAERDRAIKSLQDATSEHQSQLDARATALWDAEQKLQEFAVKLEAAKTQILSQQDVWQSRVDEVEAAWRKKYEALEINLKDAVTADLNKELKFLGEKYDHLKTEYDSFREMANNMMEAKDQEIAHLLDELRDMQSRVQAQPKAIKEEVERTGSSIAIEQEDLSISSVAVAEQQILLLARQQAQREEELAQCQRHIQALQDEITELEHENRLHTQQETMLKEELRNSERSKRREGVDMTYLKNVIVKLLETGEVEVLLPVIAMLLQFSPEELRKCQETYNAVPDIPLSSTAAVVDAAASAPRSLFSRLTFSKAGR